MAYQELVLRLHSKFFIWGVFFGRKAVGVLNPDWFSRKSKVCDCWQTHWWSRRVLGWIAGRSPSWHSPYTWGKSRKNLSQEIRKVTRRTVLDTIR